MLNPSSQGYSQASPGNTSLLIVSGRTPSFNFQCLKPQRSVDDHLPIRGNYRGNPSPTRSRLQVKQWHTHTLTHCQDDSVHVHAVSLLVSLVFSCSCSLVSDPTQPGLAAQQRFLDVFHLLGEHSSSWQHSCSRNNPPLRTQGQAHLHPYDPGGRGHRHQPADVEQRLCQPPCWTPSGLVPWPGKDLHQHEDATSQPGPLRQRQRRQPGRVGE